jgi:hypothetical protein
LVKKYKSRIIRLIDGKAEIVDDLSKLGWVLI